MSDGLFTEGERNDWAAVDRVPEKLATIPDLGGATYDSGGGASGASIRALVCSEDGETVVFAEILTR